MTSSETSGVPERSASFAHHLGQALSPEQTALPPEVFAGIVETYDYTLRAKGPTPKSVLWRGWWSQRVRFQALLKLLTPDEQRERGLVINDFGCGYGAFFGHIRRRRWMKTGKYYGYDLCPAMVRAGRERYDDPRAEFIDADRVCYQADFTVACGAFGLRLTMDEEAWRDYIQKTLCHLADYSRRGLAFNLLDRSQTPPTERRETLFYADPQDFLQFCRRSLSENCQLLTSYSSGTDFTLLVRFDA